MNNIKDVFLLQFNDHFFKPMTKRDSFLIFSSIKQASGLKQMLIFFILFFFFNSFKPNGAITDVDNDKIRILGERRQINLS